MERQTFLYIRASTFHQTGGMASQLNALQNYCKQQGITQYKIFQDEGVSGSKSSRPALDAMMKEVSEGLCKTVIVFAFSRFSRSCSHLLQSLEYLKKHDTRMVSITEQIDTNTSIGTALMAVLGALAQLERDLVRERVVAGLARAKAAGVRLGRLKTRPSELIRALRASGMSFRECARVANVSQGSISLEIREWKKEAEKQGKTLQELMDAYNSRRAQSQKKPDENGDPVKISTSDGVELEVSSDSPKIELEIIR